MSAQIKTPDDFIASTGARLSSASAPAFVLSQVRPPGYIHAEALTEFAECVYFGLRRLGVPVFHREKPSGPARSIVFGAHLLGEKELSELPADAILYNSEQVLDESVWVQGPYLKALSTLTVWDYSAENVRRLTALGVRAAKHVPLGYVPELARIPPTGEDIDVLFYGCVNPRRQKILDALKARGLNVKVLFGVYGEERDRAIARARVVLSVHFYEAKIFEIVRAAYLFTNEKALVAECDSDTSVEQDLRDAMCGVSYDRIADACFELVRSPAKRLDLARRGHRIFARRREEDILAEALELPRSSAVIPINMDTSQAPHPLSLQLGSGKDFRAECFNVDINPAWRPDAVCDIASPDLIGSSCETVRFGTVTFREGIFEEAIANDVLEHIPQLATAMTNVLRLLRPGGVFDITVPYDLSHGAWQDPTHVRAFNERSWLYYTDWHWYLGWTEARFDVLSLELKASALGMELQRAGQSAELILRTPRAVDALHVRLRKRYLQESERREAQRHLPGSRQWAPANAAGTPVSPAVTSPESPARDRS